MVLLAASARPTQAPDASPGAPPAVRAGYERAANELLCYCGCSRLTIKDCTCGVAYQLREQFEKRLAAGESGDSIVAAYVGEHGEQSRNSPPKTGLNLLAWFGPGIAIVIAAAGTMITILIWVSRGRKAAPAALPSLAEQEDPMRKRLEDDLREYKL